MVNKTALERICEIITRENYKKMKMWSSRFKNISQDKTSWYIYRLKDQIRMILNLFSGDDFIGMLKGIFKKIKVLFNIFFLVKIF